MLFIDLMFFMLYLGILFALGAIVRWEYLRWQADRTAYLWNTDSGSDARNPDGSNSMPFWSPLSDRG